MASKQECDQYAAELNRRFEEFTRWAIANWPNHNFPLLESDFTQMRREIGEILGPKLGDGDGDSSGAPRRRRSTARSISMKPMPWP